MNQHGSSRSAVFLAESYRGQGGFNLRLDLPPPNPPPPFRNAVRQISALGGDAFAAPPLLTHGVAVLYTVLQRTNAPLPSSRPALIQPTMEPAPATFEMRMRVSTPAVEPAA
jgi:hypothetical protein